jgi:hypothetical protein
LEEIIVASALVCKERGKPRKITIITVVENFFFLKKAVSLNCQGTIQERKKCVSKMQLRFG